jgi:FAD/FMN-containing dehydrogenase
MSDFSSFKQAFKGDIVTPSDADYPKAIARWSSSAERKAKIVAFVKGVEDVVLAINFARGNKLPVAIRGGGHSVSGASSTEGGLVIDLSRHLNGVKVDVGRKCAFVQGGALWETVNSLAIQHNLAAVGGTVDHVRSFLRYILSSHLCLIVLRLVLEGAFAFVPQLPSRFNIYYVDSLTLGGGIGHLSPAHGLALDNVIQVKGPYPRTIILTYMLFRPP